MNEEFDVLRLLVGRNVSSPHHRPLDIESEPLIAYSLKSFTTLREAIPRLTVVELVRTYELEETGLRRKWLLIALARAIFPRACAALVAKLKRRAPKPN